MRYVRALFQECKPGTIEGMTQKLDETFVPRLRQIPGFVSYQVAKVDDRTVIVFAIAETRSAAEEIERQGAEWRKQNKDFIVTARPYIGEIIFDTSALPYEAHPMP